jgi:[protein-PII] uridylyltransferase
VDYPAKQLKISRQRLIALLEKGQNTKSFPEEHAALMDQYFQDSIQENIIGKTLYGQGISFAAVAIGGYGRRELCLHSDIDILLLFEKKVPEEAKRFMQKMLFPLWDLGLDLGHSTRSIKDCLSMAKKDFESLTSLLDARFIGGEYTLYINLIEKFYKKVVSKNSRTLYLWLIKEDKKRLAMFGDSSYLLEPNLKEGIGGLRNYHHMLWQAKALFGPEENHDQVLRARLSYQEYQDLNQLLNFLLYIRNELHLLSHRKNDRLTFEYQDEIARRLGLRDRKASHAVEQFNSLVHATMGSLKTLSHSFTAGLTITLNKTPPRRQIRKVYPGLFLDRGELFFDSAPVILADPSLLMTIYEHSARLSYPLSLEARRMVRELLYLVDDSFRQSQAIADSFIKIVTKSEYIFEALSQMIDSGFLDRFIPEFGRIRNLVEFDAYHIYPVGIHCLYTLKYLEELSENTNELQHDLFVEITHPERLLMAGLFHDIGKHKKDHASTGAVIARKILTRFQYDRYSIHDICFLVRYHLLLAETATRRDLNDEKVIVQCARIIGSVERLKMLYLLTWADSLATGPKAWNDWIGNLIRDLVFKIMHILERGDLATPAASRKIEHIKSEVRKHIVPGAMVRDLEASFEHMPTRYLLNTNPQDIVRHLYMVRRLKEKMHDKKTISKRNAKADVFVFETRKEETGNYWEITIVAQDEPGLFADMAGVLALNTINILSADIYTWHDGTAVDVVRTTKPLDNLFIKEKWVKVQEDFTSVLAGTLSLDADIGTVKTRSNQAGLKKLLRPHSIVVDNESSDFFTVVEVYAHDYAGLLYRITRALFDLGLDIHSARIATKIDQVVDVFYVRDLDGQKIENHDEIKKIKKVLHLKIKQQ